MDDEQLILDEVQRLRTVDGFKESVQDIEMESRHLRRRRMPYLNTLDRQAVEKADAIIAAEGSIVTLGLTPDGAARLLRLLADEFVKECRDGL